MGLYEAVACCKIPALINQQVATEVVLNGLQVRDQLEQILGVLGGELLPEAREATASQPNRFK